ncbi:MAG: LCP family protein [Candidatus Gracilibacteria bacterium]|jgi:LCP family protein required for cell wall assembly|nr:LCP family protein [Candidatus Gracilibacteria bacterium]
MNFKTRKISSSKISSANDLQKNEQKPERTNNTPKKIPKLTINLIATALILLILVLTVGIYKTLSEIDYSVLLKVAGTKLMEDDHGLTNFMILGIGGKNHDGGDLTDTIMIASLDNKNHHVSMVSIPRDIYLKDATIGNSKINEMYYYAKKHFDDEKAGLDFFKTKVEELIDTEIHYYILVDFKGFKEIVDIIGGVEVQVENDIYDPYYPKDGTYLYETFSIKKGLQSLDGELALKYARSRKTTSDFDRSFRQQQIIYAIKEKAMSGDVLFSSEKISEILDSLKSNIFTNITVGEILTLGAIAKDYSDKDITHQLLHDDPNFCGGLLYTPPRIEYNNAFVLLPAGGDKYLHIFFNLLFNFPKAIENTKIHVLNGTATAGVAGETKQILTRYCFDINRFGNGRSQKVEETTYYYKEKLNEKGEKIDSRPLALDFLQTIIPGKETTVIPEEYAEYMTGTDLIMELGNDYVSSENYLKDPFYYLILYTPTPGEVINSNTTPN